MMKHDDETGWLVLGPNGQLGKALQAVLAPRDAVTFCSRHEINLAYPDEVKDKLEQMQPSAIINASAYTAVDKAEEEPERAMAINAESVGVLARYAAARSIPLVHYSTDYVYGGQGDAPQREDEEPAPLNVYGQSKLAGERAIIESGCDHLIFRTSWVYDAESKNFLTTMLRLGAEREELRIVADQIGAPTYAPHLAAASMACFEQALAMEVFPSGIYNMAGGGEVSWHGFAEAIFAQAHARGMELTIEHVQPIPSSAYPTPAARPLNSRMDMGKLQKTFGVKMPDWYEGLADCLFIRRST